MTLKSFVFLACIFTSQAFPFFGLNDSGEQHGKVKGGLSFDLFIKDIKLAFQITKGEDEKRTEGIAAAFRTALAARKDKDDFATDDCLKTYDSELEARRAKGPLTFDGFIDTLKNTFNEGKELTIDFLNDFKTKLEDKVSDVTSDFVNTFISWLSKHKSNESPEQTDIDVDLFVRAVFSAFGAKDNVISQDVVLQVEESFRKTKGIDDTYLSYWNKAFESCRAKSDSIDVDDFISILKSSGCTYVPIECLEALKSPENSCAFPDGVWDNLQVELKNLEERANTRSSSNAFGRAGKFTALAGSTSTVESPSKFNTESSLSFGAALLGNEGAKASASSGNFGGNDDAAASASATSENSRGVDAGSATANAGTTAGNSAGAATASSSGGNDDASAAATSSSSGYSGSSATANASGSSNDEPTLPAGSSESNESTESHGIFDIGHKIGEVINAFRPKTILKNIFGKHDD